MKVAPDDFSSDNDSPPTSLPDGYDRLAFLIYAVRRPYMATDDPGQPRPCEWEAFFAMPDPSYQLPHQSPSHTTHSPLLHISPQQPIVPDNRATPLDAESVDRPHSVASTTIDELQEALGDLFLPPQPSSPHRPADNSTTSDPFSPDTSPGNSHQHPSQLSRQLPKSQPVALVAARRRSVRGATR